MTCPKRKDVCHWLEKIWNKFPVEILSTSFTGSGYYYKPSAKITRPDNTGDDRNAPRRNLSTPQFATGRCERATQSLSSWRLPTLSLLRNNEGTGGIRKNLILPLNTKYARNRKRSTTLLYFDRLRVLPQRASHHASKRRGNELIGD